MPGPPKLRVRPSYTVAVTSRAARRPEREAPWTVLG